ncbi:MAG TPA: hypothetical protein VGE29_08165 [Prosthecobacter sp.]
MTVSSVIDGIKKLAELTYQFSVIFIPTGGLVSFLVYMFSNVGNLAAAMDTLTAKLNQMAGSIQMSGATAYLGQANRVFPWTEVLAMLGILATTKLSCAMIRIIKSWLPTVN